MYVYTLLTLFTVMTFIVIVSQAAWMPRLVLSAWSGLQKQISPARGVPRQRS